MVPTAIPGSVRPAASLATFLMNNTESQQMGMATAKAIALARGPKKPAVEPKRTAMVAANQKTSPSTTTVAS